MYTPKDYIMAFVVNQVLKLDSNNILELLNKLYECNSRTFDQELENFRIGGTNIEITNISYPQEKYQYELHQKVIFDKVIQWKCYIGTTQHGHIKTVPWVHTAIFVAPQSKEETDDTKNSQLAG